nr:MAG TPA: hypothetical protein [Caudoviricetes sp.]
MSFYNFYCHKRLNSFHLESLKLYECLHSIFG